jgi:hypothetical protein
MNSERVSYRLCSAPVGVGRITVSFRPAIPRWVAPQPDRVETCFGLKGHHATRLSARQLDGLRNLP